MIVQKMGVFSIIAVFCVLLAAGQQAIPATAADKPARLLKLTYGSGAASATVTPIWVAQGAGLFAKYGIEFDGLLLRGGSQVAQALASGSLQMSGGGLGAMLDAKVAGADVIVIATPYPWHFFQIYARPEIKTWQELRGKSIAASDPGASSDRAIRQALGKYGMEEGKDYYITYVGGTRERVLALEQKLVDAAIISPPNGLIAGKKGFNKVLDLIADKISFGYAGMGANATWAKQNPTIVENFLKAYVEGLALAKKDKAFAMKMMSKEMGIKDQDILEEAYDLSVARMPLLPYTDRSLIEFMLSHSKRPEANTVDPTTLYDNSYLKKIEASGFLEQLSVQR